MILLISNTQDLTCDFVVRELRRQSTPFRRLNTDEFPIEIRGAATAGRGTTSSAHIKWLSRETQLELRQVVSILYRRPVSPIPPPSVTQESIRQFCTNECYEFLRGLWLSLDCHWISHPDAIRRAEHKLYQLRVAETLPLLIPKTLFSNDPVEIRHFFYLCSGKMVVKPMYIGHIPGEEPVSIFTSVVPESDLQHLESAELCPSIFQELVDKAFDVRVTVIGNKVFAAKIESDLPPEIPDWRFCGIDKLKHSRHSLPTAVERTCCALVAKLGLDFGAIDFAVNAAGEYFFLEINPNGQWAWLETELGLPISSAIANRLRGD